MEEEEAMSKIMSDVENYFDWAATAIPDGAILEESDQLALECFGNPSSTHRFGKLARSRLTEARERSAAALGVGAETLYFTSGGTEANQLPLLSLLKRPRTGNVALSEVEHPAVAALGDNLAKAGIEVRHIKSDTRGIVTVDEVLRATDGNTLLVAVMAVNNESGAVQPIGEIAASLAARAGAKRRPHFHADCVQAAGKVPLDLTVPGLDSAAFSAHKLRGPRGIGLLYLTRPLEPFLGGGGQEGGLRSGTENLAGAWAFSRCLERYYVHGHAHAHADSPAAALFHERTKATAAFLTRLAALPGCTILPPSRLPPTRLTESDAGLYSPYIVQAAFEGIPGEVLVRTLDDEGIAASTGSACASNGPHHQGAHPGVLAAMGISPALAQGAVRLSFGYPTTQAHLDRLLATLAAVTRRLGATR
jgi:cysteine desulfurase